MSNGHARFYGKVQIMLTLELRVNKTAAVPVYFYKTGNFRMRKCIFIGWRMPSGARYNCLVVYNQLPRGQNFLAESSKFCCSPRIWYWRDNSVEHTESK